MCTGSVQYLPLYKFAKYNRHCYKYSRFEVQVLYYNFCNEFVLFSGSWLADVRERENSMWEEGQAGVCGQQKWILSPNWWAGNDMRDWKEKDKINVGTVFDTEILIKYEKCCQKCCHNLSKYAMLYNMCTGTKISQSPRDLRVTQD